MTVLLLGALGFVAGGVLLLLIPYRSADQPWIAWTSITFFGVCALVATRHLVDTRPRLILDDCGLFDRTMGVGPIPWSEILDAHVYSVKGSDFISLDLRTPELWLHKLSPVQLALVKANKTLGFGEFNMNLAGLSVSATQIHELTLKRSAAGRGSEA